MYRAFTYYCLINDVDFEDDKQINKHLNDFNCDITGNNRVFIDKKDITDELETSLILDNINKISCLGNVRNKMVRLQKNMAINKGVVMVGRDISTVVLPDAELKIYLFANLESRAKRRWIQIQCNRKCLKNEYLFYSSFDSLLENMKLRDEFDENRLIGPLKISDDAIVIDNSNMTQDEIINKVYKLIVKKIDLLKRLSIKK